MDLPFSHDAFLDVFGAYNTRLWPAVVLLWVLTAAAAWRWRSAPRSQARPIFALLALHWAWSGIAYHWLFFRPINPVAALFSAGFVVQAVLFAWLALRSRSYDMATDPMRTSIAGALLVYGLIYPIIGLGTALEYPRLPLFAVPCPTTLVTAGVLIGTNGVPRIVVIVPILWAVIGSSAAFMLGIYADLALVAAGALLAVDVLAPTLLGRRSATA